MIVIKMEIWPNGSRNGRVEAGVMTIENVTPEDLAVADYAVRLYHGDAIRDLDQVVRDARASDVIRHGLVQRFRRLHRNAWSLLFLALASLSPAERNEDDLDFEPSR
jgi:hypothetical protein